MASPPRKKFWAKPLADFVLGDRDAHAPVLHVAQLCYLLVAVAVYLTLEAAVCAGLGWWWARGRRYLRPCPIWAL